MAPMDPFAVLEVDPGASPAELTAAYRRLAKRWHPDAGGAHGREGRMAELNVAYDLARSAAYHRRAAPPPAVRRSSAGRGAWLPEAVRRALGPELLSALAAEEHVEAVAPTAMWASPEAVLAVTDRRLLWLLDDAPVHRVRQLRYVTVAAVERRAARLRRGAAAVRVRATNGQRFTFAELPPATAERIAGYVVARRRRAATAAFRPSPARPVPGRTAAHPPR